MKIHYFRTPRPLYYYPHFYWDARIFGLPLWSNNKKGDYYKGVKIIWNGAIIELGIKV